MVYKYDLKELRFEFLHDRNQSSQVGGTVHVCRILVMMHLNLKKKKKT